MNKSDKRKILVIGAGWEQEALLREMHQDDFYIIASNPNLNGSGLRYADQYYIRDSRDIESHLKIAIAHGINAIVTDNCDYSFLTAAIVAERLKLPFANTQSAFYSNDKLAQRIAVSRSSVQQPNFKGVHTLDELRKAALDIGFPSILKPVDSRGTFGITILNNQADLESAYFHAIANSPSRKLILENFVKGTLVTVDGFCFSNGHKSLAVASRKYTEGSRPITKEIIYPGFFNHELQKKLLEAHEKVVKALAYSYGHTHGEYLVTDDEEIFLVECTNRGGGVYTSSVMVPFLTGINLNQILIDQSLGRDKFLLPNQDNGYMKKSAILAFLDYEIGKVINTINIEEMQQEDYTLRFRSRYGSNDMVESIENGAGRHSMVVIKGNSREEALQNFINFKAKLKITYH